MLKNEQPFKCSSKQSVEVATGGTWAHFSNCHLDSTPSPPPPPHTPLLTSKREGEHRMGSTTKQTDYNFFEYKEKQVQVNLRLFS